MEMSSKLYLEKLLSAAGCRNAAEISERFAAKFFSLYDAIQADEYKLKDMGFNSKEISLIRLTAALTSRRITDRFKSGKRYSDEEIRELVSGLLFACSVESVYMLSFDKHGKFIAADLLDAGTVNASGVIPRKMLDIVLRRNAQSVILAHNHPCGRPVPSESDVITTASVASICQSAGIKLSAHYVAAGFEMYDCMSDIESSYSEERILSVSASVKCKI